MTTPLEVIDKLMRVYPQISVEPIEEKLGEFNRRRIFVVNNTRYMLEWYKNSISIFTEQHVSMYFEQGIFEISGTWPNGYRNSIQIHSRGNLNCMLCIPVEKYPKAIYNSTADFSSIKSYNRG